MTKFEYTQKDKEISQKLKDLGLSNYFDQSDASKGVDQ